MDFNKIFIKNANPTRIGGQAVLEGIMMKGPDRTAVVLRKPNGKLHMKVEPLKAPSKWMKIPVIRGVVAFADALVVGTRTLMYSAEVLESFEEAPQEKDRMTLWLERKFGEKGAMDAMMYFSVVLALVFTVGIFIILPTAVVHLFETITSNEIALNLMEGIFRIALFVIYVVLISRMKDIQRVFEYHGAEHKTIHCFENGLPLEPKACNQYETLHPRCGTSFLMFVMVISLILFSLLGWPNLIIRILSRLLLIPVVAGLSFELLRWAGRSDSLTVKILSYPGLLLQKLTTRNPDEKQLEVAIVAMEAVMDQGPVETYEIEVDPSVRFGNREIEVPNSQESSVPQSQEPGAPQSQEPGVSRSDDVVVL